MGILQTIDEAGSVSASAEECGSAQETLDLSRLRCHVVMVWFRDAIASPCSYVGLKDQSSRLSPLGKKVVTDSLAVSRLWAVAVHVGYTVRFRSIR
jgi:hypothetical protein